MNPSRPNRTARRDPTTGLTRIELCCILAVLGLLAGTVLPGIGRVRAGSQNLTCLENSRQLIRALLLYASEHSDYLPPNPADGNSTPNFNWVAGSAGVGGAQEFNPDVLTDPRRCSLAPYLGGDTAVFRCPEDVRVGRYQGTNAELRGKTVPAARSYSMNLAVGTNPYRAGGKAAVDGAWLDGTHSHASGQTWYTFAKTADMRNPGPASTFVFLDEDYRSLNDGTFSVVGPNPVQPNYRMIDWPATYHDFGGTFAFGDGHVEQHAWRDMRTQVKGLPGTAVQPGNVDIVWMSAHATALIRQPQFATSRMTTSNTFNVTFPALKAVSYTLEYKNSLTDPEWVPLPEVVAPTNGPLEVVDPAAANPQRFYRAWTR